MSPPPQRNDNVNKPQRMSLFQAMMLHPLTVTTFIRDKDGFYLATAIAGQSRNQISAKVTQYTDPNFRFPKAHPEDIDVIVTTDDLMSQSLISNGIWGRLVLIKTPFIDVRNLDKVLQPDKGVGFYIMFDAMMNDKHRPPGQTIAEIITQVVFYAGLTDEYTRRMRNPLPVPDDFIVQMEPDVPGVRTVNSLLAGAKTDLQNAKQAADTQSAQLASAQHELDLVNQKATKLALTIDNFVKHNTSVNDRAAVISADNPFAAVQMLLDANANQNKSVANLVSEVNASTKKCYSSNHVMTAVAVTAMLSVVATMLITKKNK